MLQSIVLVLGGYLVGSIASAILVCGAMGLPDPREGGSGNPGATNVLRLGGKKAAALTLIGDLLKGVLPVLVAAWLGEPPWVRTAVGFAAFLGHLFPVFFGFRGGKGVATAFGALVALSGSVGLAAVATWVGVAAATRYSSLAALTASVLAPVYAAFLTGETAYVVGLAVIAALLLWRHRGNIERLLAGTESRIGEKARVARGT